MTNITSPAGKMMERLINRAIEAGTLEQKKEGFIKKLDAYLAYDQITIEEYNALMGLIGGTANAD